jgi:cobyrinic acid a,c-diamide synthase
MLLRILPARPALKITEQIFNREEAPVINLRIDKDHRTIGIIRDSAFQFYYPDNIEALKAAGASVVFISPFADDDFPDVDALYIGGGFRKPMRKFWLKRKISGKN